MQGEFVRQPLRLFGHSLCSHLKLCFIVFKFVDWLRCCFWMFCRRHHHSNISHVCANWGVSCCWCCCFKRFQYSVQDSRALRLRTNVACNCWFAWPRHDHSLHVQCSMNLYWSIEVEIECFWTCAHYPRAIQRHAMLGNDCIHILGSEVTCPCLKLRPAIKCCQPWHDAIGSVVLWWNVAMFHNGNCWFMSTAFSGACR